MYLTMLLIFAAVMRMTLLCWSVESTLSTRSAATILLVQRKAQSSRFLPKELLEVCILFYLTPFAENNPLLVITRDLRNHGAHRNPCKIQTLIEFTIVAISKAPDAVELNMEDAVAQGRVALDRMKLGPSAVKSVLAPGPWILPLL
jgi:hypothetical protein